MANIIKFGNNDRDYFSFEREALFEPEPVVDEPEPEEEEQAEPLPDPAEILAQARAEAAEKVKQAYAEGLRRGEEAGKQSFLESVGEAAQTLTEAATALREARELFLDSLEPQIVQLVTAIAERVVHREIRTDPQLIIRTARETLTALVEAERVTLHVNPTDIDILDKQQVNLLEEFSEIGSVDIVPDDTVGRGGCLAESPTIDVDARLETQLREIIQALIG